MNLAALSVMSLEGEGLAAASTCRMEASYFTRLGYVIVAVSIVGGSERCMVRILGEKLASRSNLLRKRFVFGLSVLFVVSVTLIMSIGDTETMASKGPTLPEDYRFRLGAGVDANQGGADAVTLLSLNDRAKTTKTGWATIFSDDFESDFPDSVLDIWRSDGSAEAVWDIWTCWYGDSPGKSAGCAAGGGEAIGCGGLYPGNMDSWMVYGPFSLAQPGITAAELSFNFKLESEENSDYFYTAVSTDGDLFSWVRWSGNVASGSYTMDLSDAPDKENLLGHDKVWIAFLFQSDRSNATGVGAQVDDVLLRANYPIAGAPDLQISALKNPGRVRSLLIFVNVSQGSGNPPSVKIGETDIQVSALSDSIYFGEYFAAPDESSVTITATDTNDSGTGSEQITVQF
jgi:hypothetical protein